MRGLLGGQGKTAQQKRPISRANPGKTNNAPSNRAEILAAAMAVHRRERTQALEILERTFKDLKSKPPKPSDLAGMTRLLSLRRAVLSIKGHMAHDLKRYKVLAGLKGLIGDGRPADKAKAEGSPAKPGQPVPPSRGSKR